MSVFIGLFIQYTTYMPCRFIGLYMYEKPRDSAKICFKITIFITDEVTEDSKILKVLI